MSTREPREIPGRRWPRIAAMAAVVVVTLTTAGTTGASATVPADPVVPAVNFSAGQQQALQAEVEKHLSDYGAGQQIGINQIAWDGGRTILTLPLPGETKARALTEPIAPLGVANCAYASACLWSNTNFNGSRVSRSACGTITLGPPYNSSTGSIHNNQTPGTQTVILNGSRQILNASLAPSRIHDTGVGSRGNARYWKVC